MRGQKDWGDGEDWKRGGNGVDEWGEVGGVAVPLVALVIV